MVIEEFTSINTATMKTNIFIFVCATVVQLSAASFALAASCTATSDSGYENQCTRTGNTYYQAPYYYGSYYDQDLYASYIRQLEALISQLKQLQQSQLTSSYYYDRQYSYGNMGVSTLSARTVDDDSALVRGAIDLQGADEVSVYFEFGTSRNNLNRATRSLFLDGGNSEDFSSTIHGLSSNEVYYYRAVAKDHYGNKSYGAIESFETMGRYRNGGGEPIVDTERADSVSRNHAELSGSVDMNDFDNGRVFFVFGEDEQQIDSIEHDYDTYADIDEDGDNLQKESVDSSLDTQNDYRLNVYSLRGNTDYFYALCVEYRDGSAVITCGATESFTTD
jgi:hypothetical protein